MTSQRNTTVSDGLQLTGFPVAPRKLGSRKMRSMAFKMALAIILIATLLATAYAKEDQAMHELAF